MIWSKCRPTMTASYRASSSSSGSSFISSASVIGPIPSPIIYEESRLKTRKIPFAKALVSASLDNQFRDTDLASFDLQDVQSL